MPEEVRARDGRDPMAPDVHQVAPLTEDGRRALGVSLHDLWERLPQTTLRIALAVDGAFLALYLFAIAFGLGTRARNLFFLLSLEGEGNPPSWWYGVQMLLVALVFLLLASRLFANDERIRKLKALFTVSAIGFAFISLDEIGEIHEEGSAFIARMKYVEQAEQWLNNTFFHIAHKLRGGGGVWLVVYTIIGVVLLIWLIPRAIEAYRIWPKQVATVALGFGIFSFSAAVLQVLGYLTKPMTSLHFAYVFVEQALKMGGISIGLYGAMQVLAAGADTLTQQLTGDVTKEADKPGVDPGQSPLA